MILYSYFIIIPSFFISHVFPDQSSMMSAAIKMATTIASKSPIAVQGTKININYSRDHTVDESLEHMVSSYILCSTFVIVDASYNLYIVLCNQIMCL